MNWLNWLNWLCIYLVIEWLSSNLAKNELNFLFAKFSFGKNMKGERNPNCKMGSLGGWGGSH